MARQLLLSYSSATTASQAGLAALALAFCAFALLLCASHSRKWRSKWCAYYNFRKGSDHFSVIEHLGGEHQQQQQVSVWQRNILTGGKCQLPDFSGLIMYDSAGNIVSSSKPPSRPALQWKEQC